MTVAATTMLLLLLLLLLTMTMAMTMMMMMNVDDDDGYCHHGDYDNHYVDGDDECFCSWRNIEFVQEHIAI